MYHPPFESSIPARSLPSLDPEKTAAGIVVDPRTLERVVPQSKRKDGTVRKEQKIRPGFTPQEDVGRFRSTRPDTVRSTIPGTNRTRPPPQKEDNPFAQTLGGGGKTKAQVKNEKRREKRREASGKGWDESDDELGDLKGEFERLDVANGSAPVDEEGGGLGEGPSEMEFPPLSNGEGSNAAPPTSATTSPTALEEQAAPSTEILTPPPSSAEVPETAAEQRSTTTTESPLRSSPSKPQPAALPSKPHPIQGGRNGPIGLANPPPPASQKKNARSRLPSKPTPTPPPAPEPRVRKEVRVREGGANELSSLAARVKNLVVENQKNGSVRDRKGPSEKA